MLAGVCAGIADYFGTDPTLIRVLAVVSLIVFNLAAVVAYIILIIIVPLEPRDLTPQVRPDSGQPLQ